MSATDAEKLMADYIAAYKAANGKPAPEISYRAGWFSIGLSRFKYRRHGVEQLRDELLRRAHVEAARP